MFGAYMSRFGFSDKAPSPQQHFISKPPCEPSLAELLVDPVILALAESDGLSAPELAAHIASVVGNLKNTPLPVSEIECKNEPSVSIPETPFVFSKASN